MPPAIGKALFAGGIAACLWFVLSHPDDPLQANDPDELAAPPRVQAREETRASEPEPGQRAESNSDSAAAQNPATLREIQATFEEARAQYESALLEAVMRDSLGSSRLKTYFARGDSSLFHPGLTVDHFAGLPELDQFLIGEILERQETMAAHVQSQWPRLTDPEGYARRMLVESGIDAAPVLAWWAVAGRLREVPSASWQASADSQAEFLRDTAALLLIKKSRLAAEHSVRERHKVPNDLAEVDDLASRISNETAFAMEELAEMGQSYAKRFLALAVASTESQN